MHSLDGSQWNRSLRIRVIIAACTIAMAFLFMPAKRATAQIISGRVIEASTSAPIAGAYVRLLDHDGAPVTQWLTNSTGAFHLNARTAGTYKVRIERLGFESYESDPFAVDTSMTRDFPLGTVAVELPSVSASPGSPCKAREQMTPETAVAWQEIRKALDMTSWTAGNASVQYELSDQTHWLDGMMMQKGSSPAKTTSGSKHGSPYAALASDSILQKGFIQSAEQVGHYKYLAPDAALIASDGFQATHCFRAVVNSKRVGLTFLPTGEIKPYDVTGTLWIDRASGLLTSLTFSYTKLPFDIPLGTAGGDVSFARIGDGMWIVSGWRLRVPIMTRATPSSRPFLSMVQEKSESVISAAIGGRVVYPAGRKN